MDKKLKNKNLYYYEFNNFWKYDIFSYLIIIVVNYKIILI